MKAFDLEADIKIDTTNATAALDALFKKAQQLNSELNATPQINGTSGSHGGNGTSGVNALNEAEQNTIGGYLRGAASVTIGNLASSAVNALVQAIKSGVQEGYQYTLSKESYIATFRSMLGGSQEGAEAFYEMLQGMAVKTPLSLGNMAYAAQQFLANGEAVANIDDVIMMLSDLSLGNDETFGSIALALAQTKSYGALRAQERNQFINAGIPIYDLLSAYYGLDGTREENVAQLVEMQEEGKIMYSDVYGAFQQAVTTGDYAGGSAYKMGTLGGAAQRREEQTQIYLGTLFEETGLAAVKKAADNTAADLLEAKTSYLQDFGFLGYKQWGKADNALEFLKLAFLGIIPEEDNEKNELTQSKRAEELLAKAIDNGSITEEILRQLHFTPDEMMRLAAGEDLFSILSPYSNDILSLLGISDEDVSMNISEAIDQIPGKIEEGFSGASVNVTVSTGNVVLDSGAMAGAITPKVNVTLGRLLTNS